MELQTFKSQVLPVKDKLFRIALNMMRSVEEAEDILQDVMVKLWDKRAQWGEYRNLEAFAVTITKNLCLDRLKSKRMKGHFDIQEMELDSGTVSPYQRIELDDSVKTMVRVFEQLPDQQRLLITLRDVEGYSYEEIAEQTGLEVNNIRVGISRARKKAKEDYLKIANYEQQ
ncbi:RNA polymerase subunit sigma-24 [Roseivirga seohaensis]|uniref:RNA polymerase subunit sigma-24 n=1 Tax=Roseivirga seohaensis TaxID=1914963 RepID=A0A150XM81_9BACT|nr:sigma-70 family RNA polymerase sigma factor [Roseivirga seohaensis]KYG79830.1 RNA polymerase subunit sigma-24 [Roseivirga seohaensis]|tara:strand:- start:73876 stop:74388 length:513 start_codon:yes stop_codon:yes gene_type:complete